MKILLVEDDALLNKLVTSHLKAQNYVVDSVTDGATGWSYASTFDYDLLILDLLLPQLDGLNLCQRLRAEGDTTPILLLTAENSKTIKIQALDTGADDYMVKPFDIAELEARIRALLRRGQGQASPLIAWGALLLNTTTGEVSYGDRPLKLTSKEYKFLELLLSSGSQVVGVDEVLSHLWSSDEFPVESTVRSHLRRLRNKLQKAGAPSDLITTLHGRGYYLKSPSPDELSTEAAIANNAIAPASATPETSKAETAVKTPHPDLQLPTAVATAIDLSQAEQYLQFLNSNWPTAQQTCLDKLGQLRQVPPSERAALAHSLAGTLGMFGLNDALALARQLEAIWKASAEAETPETNSLIVQLQQIIQQTQTIDACPTSCQLEQPPLWVLSNEPSFQEEIASLALKHGFAIRHFSQPEALQTALAQASPSQIVAQLSCLPLPEATTHQRSAWKDSLGSIPLVVVSHHDSLSDRLQALRWGGRFVLRSSPNLLNLLLQHQSSPSASKLSPSHKQIKVMVVDDDPHWLNTLLHQLQNWGFKVTTLADPAAFWQVLQSVNPDALILDAKIPEIDGFELCQVVRHDPQWRSLPILFLSILNDPESRQLAFGAGADDYLFKPVMVGELAHRITSRLQRIQSLEAP